MNKNILMIQIIFVFCAMFSFADDAAKNISSDKSLCEKFERYLRLQGIERNNKTKEEWNEQGGIEFNLSKYLDANPEKVLYLDYKYPNNNSQLLSLIETHRFPSNDREDEIFCELLRKQSDRLEESERKKFIFEELKYCTGSRYTLALFDYANTLPGLDYKSLFTDYRKDLPDKIKAHVKLYEDLKILSEIALYDKSKKWIVLTFNIGNIFKEKTNIYYQDTKDEFERRLKQKKIEAYSPYTGEALDREKIEDEFVSKRVTANERDIDEGLDDLNKCINHNYIGQFISGYCTEIKLPLHEFLDVVISEGGRMNTLNDSLRNVFFSHKEGISVEEQAKFAFFLAYNPDPDYIYTDGIELIYINYDKETGKAISWISTIVVPSSPKFKEFIKKYLIDKKIIESEF